MTGNLGESYPLAFSLPPHRYREWNVATIHIHGGGVADHAHRAFVAKDVLQGGLHRCKIEKLFRRHRRQSEEEPPYLPPIPVAPDLEFVSLSLLVLEPVAVRGLFSAIAADRHAAPSSRLHPRMVGKHQGAPMSLTSFHAGEIFFTYELRQCFANWQQ
jgi:hypothetical protein